MVERKLKLRNLIIPTQWLETVKQPKTNGYWQQTINIFHPSLFHFYGVQVEKGGKNITIIFLQITHQFINL